MRFLRFLLEGYQASTEHDTVRNVVARSGSSEVPEVPECEMAVDGDAVEKFGRTYAK